MKIIRALAIIALLLIMLTYCEAINNLPRIIQALP